MVQLTHTSVIMSCENKKSDVRCKDAPSKALVTIKEQLEQYKKRDLKDSYEKRLTCIVSGKTNHVQRPVTYDAKEKDQFFNEGLLDKDTIYPYYYATSFHPGEKDNEKAIKDAAQAEHEQWVKDRKKLKQDMDKMDLRVSWLQKKPNKSAMENRVMMSLLTQNRKEHEKKRLRKKAQTQRLNCRNGLLDESDVESVEKSDSNINSSSNDSITNHHNGIKSNNKQTNDQIGIGSNRIRLPEDLISYGYIMSQVKEAYKKTGCEVGHRWRDLRSSADMEPVDELEGLSNIYPKYEDVAAERTEMELSTGSAAIERKIDCWLTFEEYKEMINRSSRNIRPKMVPHHLFKNAHWPGRESNRRICYDPNQLPSITGGHNSALYGNTALFSHTRNVAAKRSNWGYDNEIKWWPTDGRYVKYGDITQRKIYQVGKR